MRSKDGNLKFLDDLARMMTGAMGSFHDVRQQIKAMVREGVEQVMNELDMVTRSEFDRVEALAEKARERQIELEKRLAALEGKKAPAAKPAAKKTAVRKPAAKKTKKK
jgi:BMFP domain-containing protein YqiC